MIGACSSSGLSEAEAVEIALAAAPQSDDYQVVQVAEAGPAGELVADYGLAEQVPRDRWVWHIVLGTDRTLGGEDAVTIVIDYIDGRVYEVVQIIG